MIKTFMPHTVAVCDMIVIGKRKSPLDPSSKRLIIWRMTTMDAQQQLHLDQLRQTYQRRLRVLEQKNAQMGLETPAHVITEMEDIRTEISRIEKDLNNIQIDGSSSDRIVVLSRDNQTTELRVTKAGLELYLHDVRPRPDRGLRWRLPAVELEDILKRGRITIRDSRMPGLGFFDIGPRKDWYYSKELFPKPLQLHAEIRKLIELAIKQSKGTV